MAELENGVQAMKPKLTKTRRLEIRPYRAADFPHWYRAWVDRLPQQNQFDVGPLPAAKCSRRSFMNLIKRHRRLAREDRCYVYGVFSRASGELVGTLDVFVMVRDHYEMGNLGYRIHNRYWNRGYGKEAARAGLRIGFEQLGLNRLEAAIDPANKASVRVARGIGMTREGIRKKYIFEGGEWQDLLVFSAGPSLLGLRARVPDGY